MASAQTTPGIGSGHPFRERLMQLAVAAAEGFHNICLPADGGYERVGGVFCWYSNSVVPVFNGAVLLSDASINRQTLGEIADFFEPRGHPYSVIFLDGILPHAGTLLEILGYGEYDSIPAMWLDGPPQEWSKPAQAENLRIAALKDPDDLMTYRSLLSLTFYIPASEVDLIMGDEALHAPKMRHYVAWLGHNPVGTISVVLGEALAGIWNVGTLPNFRRYGIATAMMRHVLSEVRALGYASSILLSSAEGLHLYSRLGYQTLGIVKVFVPRRNNA